MSVTQQACMHRDRERERERYQGNYTKSEYRQLIYSVAYRKFAVVRTVTRTGHCDRQLNINREGKAE